MFNTGTGAVVNEDVRNAKHMLDTPGQHEERERGEQEPHIRRICKDLKNIHQPRVSTLLHICDIYNQAPYYNLGGGGHSFSITDNNVGIHVSLIF